MAEHFVRAPEWTWYILGYFFFAGLTGGLYAVGTALRLWGRPQDEPTARAAFLWAFPILVLCPILLTIDLGRDPRAVPLVDELAAIPLDLYAVEAGFTKVVPNLMGA